MKELDVSTYLNDPGIIFDVRSPSEYRHGHIPGATPLPIFNDEERAEVGTLYKQTSRNAAIERGLELVGPKLALFVKEAKNTLALSGQASAKVHCWRGGMRSGSMAWLLATGGIATFTLKGGYKSFRRWCLQILETPRDVRIIGGLTGSGKTSILRELKALGEQTLDLELLASHRGSAYGKVNGPQPTNEQFENDLAVHWTAIDPSRPVWIEDESRMIGRCKLPDPLFRSIQNSTLYYIERPLEERLKILERDYLDASRQHLIETTQGIRKRLGGLRTDEAVKSIEEGDFRKAGEIILDYYDKCYRYSVTKRPQPPVNFRRACLSDKEWAEQLVKGSDGCKSC